MIVGQSACVPPTQLQTDPERKIKNAEGEITQIQAGLTV
jgi:hypothetical protein